MTRRTFFTIAPLLAFGCGKNISKPNLQIAALIEAAINDLKTKNASHETVWGLGKADRWDLNQADGKLVFTFPDKIVTCDAQIIGSFSKTSHTWLWSWDNPSSLPNLTRSSQWLRDYGKKHNYDKLTKAKWSATEEDAWEMAALATHLCDAQGAYRGPAGDIYVFMTFGAPKIQKR